MTGAGPTGVSVEEFLAKNPGSYVRDFAFEGTTYKVVVQPVPGGKGYAPLTVLASGDYNLAGRIAKAAFDARL